MKTDRVDYHSYLLRLWRVKDDGVSWRASLQEVETGELHGFTGLEDLFEFLEGLQEHRPHPLSEEPVTDRDC